MLPEKIIFIGVFLSIIGYYFYFKNMFFGQTKPNLVSWFIWMLAPFLGVFFQLQAGARLSVIPVFMAGFGPFLVLLVSLLKKNGYWKITFLDAVCGTLSIIALVLYVLTKNPTTSVIFVILSDGLAALPTLVKSWHFPESETSSIYLAGIFSQIIGLLIIKNWIFPIYSFNIYLILINISIVFSIYRKKIFKF
jgi:hypothetical protein